MKSMGKPTKAVADSNEDGGSDDANGNESDNLDKANRPPIEIDENSLLPLRKMKILNS